jgi:DNA-binding transcriptional LysR family regulator
MTLLSLRYFVEVANSTNMLAAAERLHVSQSTLSISIKKLEEELGISLFSRNNRSMQLTKDGVFFLEEVNHILGELDSLVEAVSASDHKHNTHSLIIGADAVDIANETMRALQSTVPDADITPIYGRKETFSTLLRSKELDFFFSFVPQQFDGYTSELLLEEPMLFLLNEKHPLANQPTLSLRQLARDRLILMSRGYAIYDLFEHYFIDAGLRMPHTLEVASQENIPMSVNAGFGFSFIPQCNENARKAHPTGEIQAGGPHTIAIPIEDSGCIRKVYLVHRTTFPADSLAEKYLHFVQRYCTYVKEKDALPLGDAIWGLM